MLQKLNERIQGVVAWVVIILIAITFTLFGLDYYMQSRHETNAQIEVNGQPITKEAFELNYRRTRQLRDPSQMTVASENQLKQQIMDEMIVNNVSMQSARSNGFEVGVVQANAAIVNKTVIFPLTDTNKRSMARCSRLSLFKKKFGKECYLISNALPLLVHHLRYLVKFNSM